MSIVKGDGVSVYVTDAKISDSDISTAMRIVSAELEKLGVTVQSSGAPMIKVYKNGSLVWAAALCHKEV